MTDVSIQIHNNVNVGYLFYLLKLALLVQYNNVFCLVQFHIIFYSGIRILDICIQISYSRACFYLRVLSPENKSSLITGFVIHTLLLYFYVGSLHNQSNINFILTPKGELCKHA